MKTAKQILLDAASEVESKIVAWLLKMQKRQYARDDGYGHVSSRAVAEALGMSKRDVRPLLEDMAERGLIIKCDFANGIFWRSINKFPWEMPKPPRVELPKNFILQREVLWGSRYFWLDFEAFETNELAYSHMEREQRNQRNAAMFNLHRTVQNMRVIQLTVRSEVVAKLREAAELA